MPQFVLNRNHVLRSTAGHSIEFTKGQPTHVPPGLVKDAFAIGAEPVDGDIEALDPVRPEVSPLSLEEREQQLFIAFELLEGRQARGDFNAQGLPHPKAIERITNFTPDTRERDAAWRKYSLLKQGEE